MRPRLWCGDKRANGTHRSVPIAFWVCIRFDEDLPLTCYYYYAVCLFFLFLSRYYINDKSMIYFIVCLYRRTYVLLTEKLLLSFDFRPSIYILLSKFNKIYNAIIVDRLVIIVVSAVTTTSINHWQTVIYRYFSR